MKVNQIATILNEAYHEITGESAVVNEDLNNIVDIGHQIEASTVWGDNFENYVSKIIDKVGKVVFVDRVYKTTAPNILKDSWEYGSILEKVRVDIGDYKENQTWELNPDTVFDVFKFTPPSVQVKYYNKKSTFQVDYSITRKQMKSAFRSAEDMNRFISTIENRVATKMGIAMDALIMRTIVNLIAEKIKANNNVVNLLADYKTATGDTTLTAATALTNKEFLRYAAREVMQYKQFLARASMLYNDAGYVTFTPEDKLKSVFLTDFAKALETTLYADTFNAEFVKLDGYSEVPYWQGSGTSNSFADRAKIDVIPASEGEKTSDEDDTREKVQKSNVLAVLFDEEACVVANEDPYVTSIFNPKGNFFNFWSNFDCSYLNDTAENVVVFLIED